MKLQIEQKELLNALNATSGVCGALNTLPILCCVHLEAEKGELKVTGNNLEVSVQVMAQAIIETEGDVAVPAKQLSAFVKELPKGELLELEKNGNGLHVSCNGDTSKIIGFDTDDYPASPEIKGESFSIPSSDLQSLLKKTEFAASQEEFRYDLHSIYFNKHEVVATDQSIMTKVALGVQTPQFKLPLKAAKELIRVFKNTESDVTVSVDDRTIFFSIDNVIITSRLVEGEYPIYEAIIPERYRLVETDVTALDLPQNVTVSKSELLNALKLVSVFANDKNYLTVMEISNGKMQLKCDNIETGNSHAILDCEGTGEIRIGLNVERTLEAAQHIDSDKVNIEFNTNKNPMLFKGHGNDDYIALVSPMRID